MSQPRLFDLAPLQPRSARGRLDAESEALLDAYRHHYLRERSRGTVRGEVSQLRTVVREAAHRGLDRTLREVLSDTSMLVSILTSPAGQPSRSTAAIRLGAIVAALLLVYGNEEGQQRISNLDAALPKDDGADWHRTGVILAGRPERKRAQSPTIEPSDLAAITHAVAAGKQGLRDRLLVAIHCYSGLGAGEIGALRWSEIRWESGSEVWSTPIERNGKRSRAVIFGSAASLMVRMRLEARPTDDYVFTNGRSGPISDRQVRRIVLAACASAGFPLATRTTLMSATAAYLSAEGFTDHQVAVALSIADMGTINRLLKPHQRLKAQRAASVPRSGTE